MRRPLTFLINGVTNSKKKEQNELQQKQFLEKQIQLQQQQQQQQQSQSTHIKHSNHQARDRIATLKSKTKTKPTNTTTDELTIEEDLILDQTDEANLEINNDPTYSASSSFERHQLNCHLHKCKPVPALPPIKCNIKPKRQSPLTIEEYERHYRLHASDLELIERIFYSGMASNELRAGLWPYLFGLVPFRCHFARKTSPSSPLATTASDDGFYEFQDHEDNADKWLELERLYLLYKSQWDSIQPDQELRFSTFRERKSLIERDVIRSDRSHLFYAENMDHLQKLTSLLMTYMMYDFDIGYLQGMSDIAAPILFLFNGDPVKSFWIFVEVMKLVRRNFESSQKTIHFQLNCLYRLIKLTDPKFALYLNEIDCSNCFFTFRCIVCKFKRELMKIPYGQKQDYSLVFSLWDSIWAVQRRYELLANSKYVHTFTVAANKNGTDQLNNSLNTDRRSKNRVSSFNKQQQQRQYSSQQQTKSRFPKSPSSSSISPQAQKQLLNGHLNSTISNGNNPMCSNGEALNNRPGSSQTTSKSMENGHSSKTEPPTTSAINGKISIINPPTRSNSFAACTCNLVSRQDRRKQQKSAMRRNKSYSVSNPTYKTIATTTTVATANVFDNNPNPNSGEQSLNNPANGIINRTANNDDFDISPNLLNGLSDSHKQYRKLSPQSPLSNKQVNNRSNCSTVNNGSNKINNNNPTNRQLINHQYHSNHRHLTSSPLSLSPNWSTNHWTTNTNHSSSQQSSNGNNNCQSHLDSVKQEQIIYTKETFYSSFDPNQADIPRFELTETEKFVISLCLSLIRRERNYVLAHQLDSSEIHQHFHDPKLNENLDNFIEQAYHIYHFLNSDCDIQLVLKEANELDLCLAVDDIMDDVDNDNTSQADAADTYDLLRDYLIISPASHGNPAKYHCNMSRKSWDDLVNNGD